MTETDEHLERRINRALDGELTERERLALDRELMRNPEARRVMERSGQLDALAGEALRSLLSDRAKPAGATPPPTRRAVTGRVRGDAAAGGRLSSRSSYHRAWWLVPAAAAAVLAMLVWLNAPPSENGRSFDGSNVGYAGGTIAAGTSTHRTVPWAAPRESNRDIVPVNHRPTWTDRAIDRGVYGVRGSDGNIYLIEINHTRTREHPGSQSRIYPVDGDI